MKSMEVNEDRPTVLPTTRFVYEASEQAKEEQEKLPDTDSVAPDYAWMIDIFSRWLAVVVVASFLFLLVTNLYRGGR